MEYAIAVLTPWGGTTKLAAKTIHGCFAIADEDSWPYCEGQHVLVKYSIGDQFATPVPIEDVKAAFTAVRAAWQFMDDPNSCGLSDGDVITLLANAGGAE